MTSCWFCILFTTEAVPKIFPKLNVVAHLVVPVGWGLCLKRLYIFIFGVILTTTQKKIKNRTVNKLGFTCICMKNMIQIFPKTFSLGHALTILKIDKDVFIGFRVIMKGKR